MAILRYGAQSRRESDITKLDYLYRFPVMRSADALASGET
jgi:hypothetical protein